MDSNFITNGSTGQIDIKLPKRAIDILLISLEPESKTPSSERSTVKLSRAEDGIKLIVVANDTSALRAALNSYLRWIQGILSMIEKLD
jgi:tRNA threonylcarbamoyladenosine modification (KEOPS) complex  Pcc1 subunit